MYFVGLGADSYRVGVNGYQIPWLHINENHVATTYNYDLLSLGDLMSAAESMTASHISSTLHVSVPTSNVGAVTSALGALSSKSSVVPTEVATTAVSIAMRICLV
jgi:hypothetical protein